MDYIRIRVFGGMCVKAQEIQALAFTTSKVKGYTHWHSSPDLNFNAKWSQGTKIATKKIKADYCLTMALAHAFNLIPEQYVLDAVDANNEDADIEGFLRRYALYGTQVMAKLNQYTYPSVKNMIYRFREIDSQESKPFDTGLVVSENGKKTTFTWKEEIELSVELSTIKLLRVDVRSDETDMFIKVMNTQDITATKDPSNKTSMLLLIDSHCYVNMEQMEKFRQRFQPKKSAVQASQDQQKDILSKKQGQEIPQDKKDGPFNKELPSSIIDIINHFRKHGLSPVISVSDDFNQQSCLIGQEGHVRLLEINKDRLDESAMVSSGVKKEILPVVRGLPFDYNSENITFLYRQQVAFRAQLVIFDADQDKLNYNLPSYMYSVVTEYGLVNKAISAQLKDMIVGVPLNEANVLSQKYRYLETFSNLNGTKLSFDVSGNIVQNDLDGEYNSLVDNSICYAIKQIRLEKTDLSGLLAASLPQWFKIINSHFNGRLVSMRLRPGQDEPLPIYAKRMLFGCDTILDMCPEFLIMWIWECFFDSDDIIAKKIIQNLDNFRSNLRQRIDEAINFIKHYNEKVVLVERDQDVIGKKQKITKFYGEDKLKSEFFHKTTLASYDISKCNPVVLRSIKFIHPRTKRVIKDLSPQNIYKTYRPYCTCHKNVPKKSTAAILKNLGEQLNFCAYAVCPLNAISAIVERQAASLLTYDPSVLQRFLAFFNQSGIVEKFVSEAKKLDKREYTFEKYIDHVKQSNNIKSQVYRKGRASALWNGIKTAMQCFPKAGEFFIKSVFKNVSEVSNRARNICSPDPTLLGCANHVNFIALKLLKKVCPAYTSYLNNPQLEKRLDTEWRRISRYGKPVAVSTDFSSHDSNQHAEIIDGVDNKLWRALLPAIYHMVELPMRMFKPVLNCICNLESKLSYKVPVFKKLKTYFSCVIWGTVTSGHPTRTTFGNTLRVIMYYEFIFHELGIKHYSFFVGGDDFYCIMLDTDSIILKNNLHLYFAQTQLGCVGLGQCTRKLNFLGNKVDFLSKIGVHTKSGSLIWRNFSRVAHKQQFSASRIQDCITLNVASFYSYLMSNISLGFVRNLCKKFSQSVSIKINTNDYQYFLAEKIQSSKLDGERKLYCEMFHHSKYMVQRNDATEAHFFDAVTKVGDDEGVNRFVLLDMANEIKDGTYDSLSRHMRGKHKSIQTSQNYVISQGELITKYQDHRLVQVIGRRKEMNSIHRIFRYVVLLTVDSGRLVKNSLILLNIHNNINRPIVVEGKTTKYVILYYTLTLAKSLKENAIVRHKSSKKLTR